jgi:hypothetical protein
MTGTLTKHDAKALFDRLDALASVIRSIENVAPHTTELCNLAKQYTIFIRGTLLDAVITDINIEAPDSREEYPDHGPTDPWRTSGPGGER